MRNTTISCLYHFQLKIHMLYTLVDGVQRTALNLLEDLDVIRAAGLEKEKKEECWTDKLRTTFEELWRSIRSHHLLEGEAWKLSLAILGLLTVALLGVLVSRTQDVQVLNCLIMCSSYEIGLVCLCRRLVATTRGRRQYTPPTIEMVRMEEPTSSSQVAEGEQQDQQEPAAVEETQRKSREKSGKKSSCFYLS